MTVEKIGFNNTSCVAKKHRRHFKILTEKGACHKWPMMIFIHSGNKIRIYKVSSGNKL